MIHATTLYPTTIFNWLMALTGKSVIVAKAKTRLLINLRTIQTQTRHISSQRLDRSSMCLRYIREKQDKW